MHRAVFLSDVHLGSTHCHADELANFLSTLRCRRLYLVGDIVDLWWLAQKRATWGEAQHRVIGELHALARQGCELIYVPGNHDRPMRQLCGLVLPRVRFRRRTIHTMLDGRRLLVTHGDDYDGAVAAGDAREAFGNWLYYVILSGNRVTNALRRRLGLRYWSLADFLKRKSSAAEHYIERFVRAGLDDARRRGLDGIICGHIHRADLRAVDGLVYANDGDWVESLSVLAEDADGNLKLLTHTGAELACLASRVRPLLRIAEAA
jgi:UDP-2,3-diacylglucosamine pyrophosphatase LpxH